MKVFGVYVLTFIILYSIFNQIWTSIYLEAHIWFVVFNDYDLNHHYETKHTEKYQNLIDMELEKLLMRLHFLLRFTPPLMELSCHSLLRDY